MDVLKKIKNNTSLSIDKRNKLFNKMIILITKESYLNVINDTNIYGKLYSTLLYKIKKEKNNYLNPSFRDIFFTILEAHNNCKLKWTTNEYYKNLYKKDKILKVITNYTWTNETIIWNYFNDMGTYNKYCKFYNGILCMNYGIVNEKNKIHNGIFSNI